VNDPHIERLATLITSYSTPVGPKETAAIIGGIEAAPLLASLERAVLARGGFPVVIPTLGSTIPTPGLYSRATLLHGNDDQVAWISPLERFAFTEADHLICVLTDMGPTPMEGVDPARMAAAQRAKAAFVTPWMERSASGLADWVVTIVPTASGARDAGMDLDAYRDFIYRTLYLDRNDPVAAWQDLAATNDRLIARLRPASRVRIEAPGTDLTLRVDGRTWINADGKRNLPDGEVFTAPIETSASGHIRFTEPLLIGDHLVSDIRLTFDHGVVTHAEASDHVDALHRLLEIDEGARRIGEFAFGTNTGITTATRNVLLDEKLGGSVHLALGASYPECGGTNVSAIHQDLICDLRAGGRVTLDGVPFLVDGVFVAEGGA
jgi:aminopeptidase